MSDSALGQITVVWYVAIRVQIAAGLQQSWASWYRKCSVDAYVCFFRVFVRHSLSTGSWAGHLNRLTFMFRVPDLDNQEISAFQIKSQQLTVDAPGRLPIWAWFNAQISPYTQSFLINEISRFHTLFPARKPRNLGRSLKLYFCELVIDSRHCRKSQVDTPRRVTDKNRNGILFNCMFKFCTSDLLYILWKLIRFFQFSTSYCK